MVDDDYVDFMIFKRAYSEKDNTLIYRNDAYEGLDFIVNFIRYVEALDQKDKENTELMVFLDINMPKMNGIDLLRALKKIIPNEEKKSN